jgi:Kelch motif
MYVFGGWNGADTLDELCTYSFLSNYWYQERIQSGPKPASRYRHASVVIGSSMFIFGGVDKL